MGRLFRGLVGLAGIGVLVGLAAFLIGMRRKSPAVLDAVREFNKAVSNPKQMETAGTPGAYASIIEHTGRKSGSSYRTPVGTMPTDDGFAIMLPYGTRPDWVQNVLTAGTATITAEGETVAVDQPEIVPFAAVSARLPDNELRLGRLFNVEQALTLRRAPIESA